MSAIARLRLIASILALLVLALAVYSSWQAMRLSASTYELQQARRDLQYRAEDVARERLRGHRGELVRAVDWLDQFYRSPEGLQRSTGLWLPDAGRADGEAVAVWILDVYLPARVGGASEEQARQAVIDGIKATDEWRRRHAGR
jgi:hypothetical protein